MRARRVLATSVVLAGAALLWQAGGRAQSAASVPVMTDPGQARLDYVENCGGCHGIEGRSAPAAVPELRDRVGYFMCTAEARAYLVRLPNVALSRISDNAQLADLLNFVVFDLGGSSVPAGSRPFTEAEVAHERQFALTTVSLRQERARHVEQAIRGCRAPASLRSFYPGQPEGAKLRR